MQIHNQVPPVGPTYIYIRGKEKKKKRGELLCLAGKQFIKHPQYPNDVNATGITTYSIKMKVTTF